MEFITGILIVFGIPAVCGTFLYFLGKQENKKIKIEKVINRLRYPDIQTQPGIDLHKVRSQIHKRYSKNTGSYTNDQKISKS